ncbi:hypothetical protein [Massilia endophytica]|uniref:hypothetical protein n=1 Tax=Massilia endophytica TaxID=2899220 RepID=UPI001E61FEF3|nr:hypothetical protein [Massilia endophytica]UGQ48496.1 hypothetical protein LSQ66_08540 [Massilia endophytica]
MKDSFYLLLTAIVCSALAWAFWHYAGASAISALTFAALLGAMSDNFRLRRRLRELEQARA